MTERIALELTTAQVDEFCRQIRDREYRPADALRALTTLQAFVNAHAIPTAGQIAARDILAAHCEQLRAKVLSEVATEIRNALARQSSTALAACYTRLSRSGFTVVLHAIFDELGKSDNSAIIAWARTRITDAQDTSDGYPDTINYHAAGLTPAEHQSLQDLLDNSD